MIAIDVVRRAYEVSLYGLFLVTAVRSFRTRGAVVTFRELAFGFALSQGVELLAVARGRYAYPDWLLYFPRSPAWVPLGIGLGWAALVPIVMQISEWLLGPSAARWRLAALDGAIAVGLDLFLDPIVSGEPLRMWMWRGPAMTPYRLWLLGVPVFNFVGWFVLVSACTFQLRAVDRIDGRAARLRRLAMYFVGDVAVALAVMALPW